MYKEKKKFGIVFLSIFVAIFVISLSMLGVNKALAVNEENEEGITPEQSSEMYDSNGQNLSDTNSNGSARPVWIIGHRANNRGDVDKALRQGANGVEIDIRRGDYSPDPTKDESKWLINHDGYRPPWSLTLEEYFAFELRDSKKKNDPNATNTAKDGFCVLFLDIKTPDKDLNNLQWQIRGWMKEYKLHFFVVYQVETYKQAMMSGGIGGCWCNGEEGVCVAWDSAENGKKWNDWCVKNWQPGMTHCWFGNGFGLETFWWTTRATYINNSLIEGKKLRDDRNGAIQKIGTWSLNSERAVKNALIDFDCDWALCEFGGGDVAPNGRRGVKSAQAVLKEYSDKIRLANINDYPFWDSWKRPLPWDDIK